MIEPGEIHVWYRLTEAMDGAAMAQAHALLSVEERARCERFRFAVDRRDYTAAHALLRTALAHYDDAEPRAWTFDGGVNGKPRLPTVYRASDGQLSFNLSHAKGFVTCAIASGTDVGIDVERTDVTFDCTPLVLRYLSAREVSQLNRCPPHDRLAHFFQIWTLKEAFLKCSGEGFVEPLPDISFDIGADGIGFVAAEGVTSMMWQFGTFVVQPHFRVSVAVASHDVRRCTLHIKPWGEQSQPLTSRLVPRILTSSDLLAV
jgi:4'-phosphopantetheinyl transferase